MGLLAFLLAFTFGMAATRFDSRKQAVLQEANAIGTAYLRTSFLPETLREDTRNSLPRVYWRCAPAAPRRIATPEGMARSSALHDQLWAIATSAEAISDTVSTGLFVESINAVIDLDATRVTANRNRIPGSIWLMLGVVTIFSMASIGYEFGLTGERSWALTILMAVAFTAVITLIADLDRSQSGLLRVGQQPLIDLQPPAMVKGVPQEAMHGVSSLKPTFDTAQAPEVRTLQYYELYGYRGLYLDGWKPVTFHAIPGIATAPATPSSRSPIAGSCTT